MIRKALLVIGLLVVCAILVEGVALLSLRHTLTTYKTYWQQRANEPGTFVYVALGDSAAQGIGASSPEKGYVGVLADRIARKTGKQVQVINLSVSGAKLDDVLRAQIPQLKSLKPDLVTMEAGANDVAIGYNQEHFAQSYPKLAAALPAKTVVSNMPFFGGRLSHNTEAMQASQVIIDQAKAHSLKIADLELYTRRGNSYRAYAADFFHPSDYGYQNWANAFWEQIEKEL